MLGGGIHLIPNSQTKLGQKTHKLQLNSLIKKDNPQVSFSIESIKFPETTLDLRGELSPSLEITLQGDAIEKEKITSSIKNVQAEISKESQLTETYKQVSSEFETLSSKHLGSNTKERTQHLKNLKKVQLKVHDWQSSKETNSGESAKTAKNLSQDQRDSIQKIYELHQELNVKKNSLNSQLEKIETSSEVGSEGAGQESPAPTTPIKEALESIGWSQEKVKVRNKSENTDNWEDWSQNPYKNFYEREDEYKSALNGNGDGTDGQKDSQVTVEFQVASKLLSIISPPDITSYPKELLDSLRKEESPELDKTQEDRESIAIESAHIEMGRRRGKSKGGGEK